MLFMSMVPLAQNAGGPGEGPEQKAPSSRAQPVQGPDLTVTNISLSTEDPVDGASIRFFARVENIGNLTAEDFIITLFAEGSQVSTMSVTSLGKGNSTTASAEIQVHAGYLEIKAQVDITDKVLEVSEANNFLVRTLHIASADLYFSDVSFYPANYSDGDRVLVTSTIVNGGADTISHFTSQLMVDDQILRSKVFHGLGSMDSLVISGEWDAVSGPHDILAKADTDSDVREINESNNIKIEPLGTTYPELTIGSLRVTPGLVNISDGDTIIIEASVENRGQLTHGVFSVRFLVDGVDLSSGTLNGIGANSTTNISFEWVAEGGSHELRVDVDNGQRIVESNEGNNFRLMAMDIPLPDIELRRILSSPAFPVDGSEMNLSAELWNVGLGDTHRNLYVQFFGAGALLGQVDVKGGLDANDSTIANLSMIAPSGRIDVLALVDGSGSIPEMDEGNNRAFTTLMVPFPDIAPTNLTIPSGMIDGETRTIKVTVVNNGPGNTSRTFFVDFNIDGTVISRVPVQGLAVGSSRMLSASFTAQGGEQAVSVKVDGGDVIREANETNNVLQNRIIVGLADLVAEDVAWVPPAPSVGEIVTITGVISNSGQVTQRSVFVEFIMDGTVVATDMITGPSLIGSVMTNAQWKVTGREQLLELRIDGSREVPEVDETNNNITRTFPAGSLVPNTAGPDLVVTDLSWLPNGPSDGEEVSFVISMENQGAVPDPGPDGSSALTPTVTLMIDNVKVAATTVKILSTEAVAVVPWIASVGEHRVSAIVDWGSSELETDETNNIEERNLTIKGPDLTLSNLKFISGSPDDGNQVALFVQVNNLGARTIRSFSLNYFVDGMHVGKEDVEGALINRSTTVTHNWEATPGAHTVSVEATLHGNAIEQRVDNNAITANETILVPNLKIISMEAAAEVDDGTQSLVKVRVRNDGNGSTTRTFLVSFYIDGEESGSRTVNGLPAGGEAVVSRGIAPGPGKHFLRVVADPAGSVVETDELDNTMSREGLNVTSSDLTITSLDLASQDDRSTQAFATIRNIGNTTTRSFGVAFYSDGEFISTTKLDGLAGGYGTTVSAEWPHMFGTHRLRAIVDPWGSVAEILEANNQRVLDTPFLEYPDLYIDELDILGPLVPGAELAFMANIRNIGGDTFTPFNVRFVIDGEQLGEVKAGGLAGMENLHVLFKTLGKVGRHHLRVEVDALGTVPESNDMNNAQSTTFTIGAPDLKVTEIQAFSHPDGVVIFAKVRNDGTHLLTPVVISFYGDGELVGETHLRGLPALTSTQVMAVIPSDTYEVRVVADGKGEVPEVFDNNNGRTLRVRPNPIEGDIDLAVSDIFWIPQFPVDGQSVTFFAVVENIGNGTVLNDIVVDFLVNNVSRGQGHIGGLLESGSTIVTATWDMVAGEDIEIGARLDPQDSLDDMDPSNDRYTTFMNISRPDLRIGRVEYSDGLFGEDGAILVKVFNGGEGDTVRKFTTNVYLEGDLLISEGADGIPAGSNSTLTFKIDRSWGEKELLAQVDAKLEINEVDETNTWLGPLDLGYPDLAVNDVWYETSANASTTTAFAQISSLGLGIGTDFQARMSVNGVDLGPKTIHGLDLNMSAVVPWTFSTREVLRLEATVDDLNVIPESNELNNQFERNVTGNATYVRPDVNLHLVRFNISQSGTPTNQYTLTAIIHNQGQNVSYFDVTFLVDGRIQIRVPVQGLGQNATTHVSYTHKGTIEDHVFKVVVDSNRAISEYDETDNGWRKRLTANHPPIAYPGNNQTITEGDRASLWARGFDPDGKIVLYEWDFQGDGKYDWSSNQSEKVKHVYSLHGSKRSFTYKATLRITDDGGARSTGVVYVKVLKKRSWLDLDLVDLGWVVPFIVGSAFIAAALVMFYLFYRESRPFKETRLEKQRRLEKEKAGVKKRTWPPWKRETMDDLEDEGTED